MNFQPARRGAVVALLALLAGCGRRSPAPDFDYTLLDGTRSNSASLRGQVLLLNFWATTCSICLADMPRLVATYRQYAQSGLQTLAVAMPYDPPTRVASYAEAHQLPFGVVIDNTGDIARRFGPIEGTPTALLIDRRGRVAQRIVGEPDFEDLGVSIERLLRES